MTPWLASHAEWQPAEVAAALLHLCLAFQKDPQHWAASRAARPDLGCGRAPPDRFQQVRASMLTLRGVDSARAQRLAHMLLTAWEPTGVLQLWDVRFPDPPAKRRLPSKARAAAETADT